jgi:hypothetical protein
MVPEQRGYSLHEDSAPYRTSEASFPEHTADEAELESLLNDIPI